MGRAISLDKVYQNVRESILELVNMIELDIDTSYVMEELEELDYKIRILNTIKDPINEEINNAFSSLYKKYNKQLSSPLNSKDKKKLIEQLNEWLLRTSSLF